MSINKLMTACALACFTLAAAPLALAQDKPAVQAKAKPAPHKAAKAAKTAKAAPAAESEPEPDVADHSSTEYACELGNKITIYTSSADHDNIALRWKNRLHRLTRVLTTTGAQRFESKLAGLTWIGIPAKGMLLDSKIGRQLANECKTPEQALGL